LRRGVLLRPGTLPTQLNQQMLTDDLASRQQELLTLKASDQKKSIGAMMGKDPSQIKAEKIEKLEAAIATVGCCWAGH